MLCEPDPVIAQALRKHRQIQAVLECLRWVLSWLHD